MNYLHNDTLKTIRLYGNLGKKFGRVHRYQVESFGDAVKALCAMLPGFEAELLKSKDRGVGYLCFYGKKNLKEKDLNLAAPDGQDIRIAPMVLGSKRNGIGQIIVGIIIVVAAYWTGGASLSAGAGAGGATAAGAGGAAGFAATFGSVAMQLGVSMMIGGVIQALSPQQKSSSTRDGPDNGASYNFNGPVNTTAQGNCIPVGYGRMIVGSAVISAGIYTEDQA